MTLSSGANGKGTIFTIGTNGSGYQSLYSFGATATDGQSPYGSLTLSLDGATLYGATNTGGSSDAGTLFSIATDGSAYQILYSFGPGRTDPTNPFLLSLLPSADGKTLYGTTENGGSNYAVGTVFAFGL